MNGRLEYHDVVQLQKHFQKYSQKHFCLSVVATKKQLQKTNNHYIKPGDFNHQQLMQKYLQTTIPFVL